MITRKKLDELVKQQGDMVLKNLALPEMQNDDAAYYLTSLMHLSMRMLYSLVIRNMPEEQAKIAFSIALESVLLDHDMMITNRLHS